ncbi:MAG TPA: hypothetical protein VK918_07175 [Pyrinomonadaceae bacterium]|nr:hypothetical protein [Pyrinomonadaceae bacterium]
MHRSMARNLSLISLLVLSLLTATASAQTETIREADYSVKLFFVIGSDTETEGRELPSEFAAFRTRVAGEYGYKNLRLRDLQQGRVTSSGLTEIKGMSQMAGPGTQSDGPVFLEWAIRMQREADPAKAAIGQFRVGIRVPIRSRAGGASGPVVNYEAVGMTASGVSVPTGEPVLMGSLKLPEHDGTLFILLRVDEIQR